MKLPAPPPVAKFPWLQAGVRFPVVLVVTSMMHVYWGGQVIVADHSFGFTAAWVLRVLTVQNPYAEGSILLGSAALALTGTFLIPARHGQWRAICVWFQQIVLLMTAISILVATFQGHFADGTRVPDGWRFISIDQSAWIAICLMYLLEIVLPRLTADAH